MRLGGPGSSARTSPGGRGEQWELAAQLVRSISRRRPRPGEGARKPPLRGWARPSAAPNAHGAARVPTLGSARKRGGVDPLCGGGGSGSDLQPAVSREALLVCRVPDTLQQRAAALSSRPALLGVRSAGGATGRCGRRCGARRAPPSSTGLARAESNRKGQAGESKSGRQSCQSHWEGHPPPRAQVS